MKREALISIIIPAYNAEKTIERCVLSAIKQDYKNIEIIIINDGSDDSTKLILEKLKINYKYLNIYNKENGGVSSARNLGIKVSSGEFIIFIDSDDYMKKNMCSKMIKHVDNEVDMVVCGFSEIKNDKLICTEIPKNQLIGEKFCINDIFSIMYYSKLLNQPWNKMFKKEKIQCLFNENKDNGEDIEFVLEYLKKNKKIVFCADELYINDISNENSLSRNYEIVFDSLISYHQYLERYIKKYFKEIQYEELSDNFVRDIIFQCFNFIITKNNNDYSKIYNKIKTDEMKLHINKLKPKSLKCKIYRKILLCNNKLLFIEFIKILLLYRKYSS